MGDAKENNIKKDSSRGAVIPHLTLEMCIRILEDGAANRERRMAAVRGLVELAGKRQDISSAMPALVSALSDQDDEARSMAARAFLRLSLRTDISSAVPALQSAINDIRSRGTMSNQEGALLDLASSALVRHYLRANQFGEAEKWLAAAPAVANYLNETPRHYGGISPESDAFIINTLRKNLAKKPPHDRYHTIEGLIMTHAQKKDWQQINEFLRSNDPLTRNDALVAIMGLSTDFDVASAMVPMLAGSLSDQNTKVQALEVLHNALRKHPNALNLEPLVPSLGLILTNANEQAESRQKAASGLQTASFTNADMTPAVPHLEKAIHDQDANVRTNAAAALANARIAARSWSVLEELASGRNPTVKPEVRKAILETIMNAAKIGKDVSHLRRMLQDIGQNDKDASVRRIANDTLVSMKPEPLKR